MCAIPKEWESSNRNKGLQQRRNKGSVWQCDKSWDYKHREGLALRGFHFTSVHSLSRVQSFVTPWSGAHHSSLSITNSPSLLKLMWLRVSDAIPPSYRLLLPSVFPSIRVFSSESLLHIRWPEYWSLSFSINPSNEYSGLSSFRIDWLDLLLSKRLSRVFSNTTVQKLC